MALMQQLTKLHEDLKETYNNAIEVSSIVQFHDELSNYVVRCSKLDENQMKQLIDCCLLFLDCMATFISTSDLSDRNEIEGLHKCFKLIRDFSSSNEFSDGFVKHIAAPLLNIVLRSNRIEWFTKELLRTFKVVFQKSSEAVRDQFENSKAAYLFKLVHQICECGDFEQQLLLLEVIYLIFSIDILKSNAPFVFPTCNLMQTQFVNIGKDYFYHGARKFLNVVNSKFKKVLSFQFESASMGDRQFEPSKDQNGISELWVDFNLLSKCFTIPCTKSSSSFQQTSDTDLEIFKVPFDHIKNVKLSHCIIYFELNFPSAVGTMVREDLILATLDFKEDSLLEALSSLFKEKFKNTIHKTPKGNSNKRIDRGGKYRPLILKKPNLISSEIETLSTQSSPSYFTCDSESQPRRESDSAVNKSAGLPLKDLSSAAILKRSNNGANENEKPSFLPKISIPTPGKLHKLFKRMGSNENDENLFLRSLKTFNRAGNTVKKTCAEEEATPSSSKRRKISDVKVSISNRSELNQDDCNVTSQAEVQPENANDFIVRANVSQESSRDTISLRKINITNDIDDTISSNRNYDKFNGSVDIIEISDDDEPNFALNNNRVMNLKNTRPSKCTNKYVSFGVVSNADTNASARSSGNCSTDQHLSRHERILENPAVQTLETIPSNELFHAEEESQNLLMLPKISKNISLLNESVTHCIRRTDTEIVGFIEISDDDADECSFKGTTDEVFSKNVNNEINCSDSAKNVNGCNIENINSTEKTKPVDIQKVFGEDWSLVASTASGNISKITEPVATTSKAENTEQSKSELENHFNRNKQANPDDLESANLLNEHVSMGKRSTSMDTPLDRFVDANKDSYSLKNGISGDDSLSTISIKNNEIQLSQVNVSTVDEDCEFRKENLNERESLYVSPFAKNAIRNTLQQSSINNKVSPNSQSTLHSVSNEIIVDGYLGSSKICYTTKGSSVGAGALETQEVNEQLSNSNSIAPATNKSLMRNSVQAELFEKSDIATVGTEDNENASSQNSKSVNAPQNDSLLLKRPAKKKEHDRQTFDLPSRTDIVQKHLTENNTVDKLPEHPPSENNDSRNAEMEVIRKVQNSPKPQSNRFDKAILKSVNETNQNDTIMSLKSCTSKGFVEKNKDVGSISNEAVKSAKKRITILQNLIIPPAVSKTHDVRDRQKRLSTIPTLQDSLTRINSDKNFDLLIKSLLNYKEMCRKGGYQAKNKFSNSKSFKRQSGRFPKLNVTDQFNFSPESSLKSKGEDANNLKNGSNAEASRDDSNICSYDAILTRYKKVYQSILKFIKIESDRGNTMELHMFIDAILHKHNDIYKSLQDLFSNNLKKNKNNIDFLKLIKNVDSAIKKYLK